MTDLKKLREELDRTYDYQLKAEDSVLAQRRRAKELEAVYAEERASNNALPHHLKG
ncbi:hypothetical protein [Nocardioides marmotae]|uniref:hypothetical protein n=1 Tax=Nocardioides marmotae TaxID=2663857 RepID=UPI0012B66D4D|nr:hypothetical protein [Nocardioides marmotae]MBC9734489.1 hypothetical protein [Nocardioides marmotae]MTB85589.1 hypothetical protein [Nocardioides marmotae]